MKSYYEFFAGGGMVNAGLGQDWSCAFANDFSVKKGSSYVANWGAETLLVEDIKKIAAGRILGHADLAWASFPCQDLSLAGNGAGLEGSRSGTFWAFIALMKALKSQSRKPRIIALENVCGTLTSNGGKDFQSIISALVELGYRVGALVIDAVHFVPQSRPRLFVVAVDAAFDIPSACLNDLSQSIWQTKALLKAYQHLPVKLKANWMWWHVPSPTQPSRFLRDIVESNPVDVAWHSQEETARLLSLMSPVNRQKLLHAQNAKALQVGAVYRRTREGEQRAEVRFDGVSGCLRTPGGGSSRQTLLFVEGPMIRSRLLSGREAARLMGLPDSYVLPMRYNDAYHLAGDGVVVPVISHLAKHLFTPLLTGMHGDQVEPRKAA